MPPPWSFQVHPGHSQAGRPLQFSVQVPQMRSSTLEEDQVIVHGGSEAVCSLKPPYLQVFGLQTFDGTLESMLVTLVLNVAYS